MNMYVVKALLYHQAHAYPTWDFFYIEQTVR